MKKVLNKIKNYTEFIILMAGVIFTFKFGLLSVLGAISIILIIESVFVRK